MRLVSDNYELIVRFITEEFRKNESNKDKIKHSFLLNLFSILVIHGGQI